MKTLETVDGRERILQAAEELFAERGYQGVSIRDIAQHTNLSHGAIYHHFGSKEELYLQVLQHDLQQIGEMVRHIAAECDTTRERVRQMVETYAIVSPRKREMLHNLTRDLEGIDNDRAKLVISQTRQEFLGILREIMCQGMARGELRPVNPALAVAALRGILHMLFDTGAENGAIPMEERTAFAEEIFFQGVGANDRKS